MAARFLVFLLTVYCLSLAGAAQVGVTVGGGSSTFSPSNVYAQPGDTVLWTWGGGVHNVQHASSGCTAASSQLFSSGAVTSTIGHTYSWVVPNTVSTGDIIHYFCSQHCAFGMKATITIGTAPPTTTQQTTTAAPTTTPASTTTKSSTTQTPTTRQATTTQSTTTQAGTTTAPTTAPATTSPGTTASTTTTTTSTTAAPAVFTITLQFASCPTTADVLALRQEWATKLAISVDQIAFAEPGCVKRAVTGTATITASLTSTQIDAFVAALNGGTAGPVSQTLLVSGSTATTGATTSTAPVSYGGSASSLMVTSVAALLIVFLNILSLICA